MTTELTAHQHRRRHRSDPLGADLSDCSAP